MIVSKKNNSAPKSEVYEFVAGASNWVRAFRDLENGWSRRKLWVDMALRTFKNKYRGAFFGAFWLSITTAITASGLGILYGYLFGLPLVEHLLYVTVAVTAWSMITGFVIGGCDVFVGNAHAFKQFPLPLSLFSFRLAFTQIIMFSYRSIVLFSMFVIFSVQLQFTALLSIAGLMLIVWIGFWMSMGLGVLNARYRDFGQLVGASMTFIFFLTPVFWRPDRLGDYEIYVNLNPFFHLIEVVRGPVLGHDDIALHFAVTVALALFAPVFGWLLYGKFSYRLPYWC